MIEAQHRRVELLGSDRAPALGGESAARRLAGFVAQRVVANKRFIGLLLAVRSDYFRLAEHRQGVGIDGRVRRGANRRRN